MLLSHRPEEGNSNPRDKVREGLLLNGYFSFLLYWEIQSPLLGRGKGEALLYSLLDYVADEVVELLHSGDKHALVG